jgi:hypothetical protein
MIELVGSIGFQRVPPRNGGLLWDLGGLLLVTEKGARVGIVIGSGCAEEAKMSVEDVDIVEKGREADGTVRFSGTFVGSSTMSAATETDGTGCCDSTGRSRSRTSRGGSTSSSYSSTRSSSSNLR